MIGTTARMAVRPSDSPLLSATAVRYAAPYMPQRFFTLKDLRGYGLTPGDIRGRQRSVRETWALPDLVAKMLRGLLQRAGFDTALPIHVHESRCVWALPDAVDASRHSASPLDRPAHRVA
jgi:hypothetical protein